MQVEFDFRDVQCNSDVFGENVFSTSTVHTYTVYFCLVLLQTFAFV